MQGQLITADALAGDRGVDELFRELAGLGRGDGPGSAGVLRLSGLGSRNRSESELPQGWNPDWGVDHTELTRILAEHGLLGLIILALLGSMVVSGFRHSRSQWNRLLVAAFSVWALTTMLLAATRLAAVGLVLALTQLLVQPDDPRLGR